METMQEAILEIYMENRQRKKGQATDKVITKGKETK